MKMKLKVDLSKAPTKKPYQYSIFHVVLKREDKRFVFYQCSCCLIHLCTGNVYDSFHLKQTYNIVTVKCFLFDLRVCSFFFKILFKRFYI